MDIRQIDQLCDQFEARLKATPELDFEAFLNEQGLAENDDLTIELLRLQLEYSTARTEVLARATARYPGLVSRFRIANTTRNSSLQSGLCEAGLPTRLGEYTLLKRIGSGGMGQVFEARHSRLLKTVAIKLLSTQLLHDEKAVARFAREMQAVGQLGHSNVICAHDAGDSNGQHYLVLEFVNGIDTATLGRATTAVPIADACEIVRQTALGLQHAHDHGLIHRDVKPGNILIASNGVVKLTDLGLATLVRLPNASLSGITDPGQVMGTLDYMAPEQCRDILQVDQRADLYSLGATLFEFLCGESPLAASTEETVLQKIIAVQRQPRPAMNAKRPDLPARLIELVDSLLQMDPEQRPTSAGDVAQRLEEFTSGHDLVQLVQSIRGVAAHSETMHHSFPETVGTQSTAPILPRRQLFAGAMVVAALAGLMMWALPDPFGTSAEPVETNGSASASPIATPENAPTHTRPQAAHAAPPAESNPLDMTRRDMELQIAEFVHSLGGTAEIQLSDGQAYSLANSGDPPDDPNLFVDWVDFDERSASQVTDGTIRTISGLGRLHGLGIASSRVTDESIRLLANAPLRNSLTMIDLRSTNIGNEGFRLLTQFSLMREFRLPSQVSIESLRLLLAQFGRQIRILSVRGAAVDHGLLEQLGQLPLIEELDLRDTPVDDVGLTELVQAKTLRRLGLSDTRITDQAVPSLEQLPNLRFLELSDGLVSQSGIRRLRNSLPACRIDSMD